jgi:hypothetical protein
VPLVRCRRAESSGGRFFEIDGDEVDFERVDGRDWGSGESIEQLIIHSTTN